MVQTSLLAAEGNSLTRYALHYKEYVIIVISDKGYDGKLDKDELEQALRRVSGQFSGFFDILERGYSKEVLVSMVLDVIGEIEQRFNNRSLDSVSSNDFLKTLFPRIFEAVTQRHQALRNAIGAQYQVTHIINAYKFLLENTELPWSKALDSWAASEYEKIVQIYVDRINQYLENPSTYIALTLERAGFLFPREFGHKYSNLLQKGHSKNTLVAMANDFMRTILDKKMRRYTVYLQVFPELFSDFIKMHRSVRSRGFSKSTNELNEFVRYMGIIFSDPNGIKAHRAGARSFKQAVSNNQQATSTANGFISSLEARGITRGTRRYDQCVTEFLRSEGRNLPSDIRFKLYN